LAAFSEGNSTQISVHGESFTVNRFREAVSGGNKVVRSKDPSVIDGFSSVQAVRHAGRSSNGPRTRPSRTTLPATTAKPDEKKNTVGKLASRIGHTVIPVKYEIVCYECAYTFTLTGRLQDTICPKCHALLDGSDHTIDREWTGTIKTIGTIELKPEGALKGGEFIARNVIIAGHAEEGIIQAYQRLALGAGATFDVARIRMKDLVIRKDGKFTITSKFTCRNLEVEGELKAKVFIEGIVRIRRGGFLRGEVYTPHLVVEEGGGLWAKVVVDSDESSVVRMNRGSKAAPILREEKQWQSSMAWDGA